MFQTTNHYSITVWYIAKGGHYGFVLCSMCSAEYVVYIAMKKWVAVIPKV
jgi:hypothetical protein